MAGAPTEVGEAEAWEKGCDGTAWGPGPPGPDMCLWARPAGSLEKGEAAPVVRAGFLGEGQPYLMGHRGGGRKGQVSCARKKRLGMEPTRSADTLYVQRAGWEPQEVRPHPNLREL